ncbi:hypothetical protein V202x_13140 [Gimesia aquarii]|uniref:Uncharacterized protein n=1 Tax=Gimesia aquarii TaxID=2527964 RepID=A0A517WRS5_9PLAN|nr:hypothetical protein V202x_13140 [Gimesia aquarii]
MKDSAMKMRFRFIAESSQMILDNPRAKSITFGTRFILIR